MQERRAFAETGHAMRLLEGVAAAVARAEPVLLVGETGTGKTAIVQHLAEQVPIQHGLCQSQAVQSCIVLPLALPLDCCPIFTP